MNWFKRRAKFLDNRTSSSIVCTVGLEEWVNFKYEVSSSITISDCLRKIELSDFGKTRKSHLSKVDNLISTLEGMKSDINKAFDKLEAAEAKKKETTDV